MSNITLRLESHSGNAAFNVEIAVAGTSQIDGQTSRFQVVGGVDLSAVSNSLKEEIEKQYNKSVSQFSWNHPFQSQTLKMEVTSGDPLLLAKDIERLIRGIGGTSVASSPALSYKRVDFFRRISKIEWRVLHQKMENLTSLTSLELIALKLGLWATEVFKRQDFSLYAMRAFLEGNLDQSQLVKLLLYDAAQSELGVEKVQSYVLYNGENLNEVAALIFKEAMGITFSEREKNEFLKEAKNLPRNETEFFLVSIKRNSSADSKRQTFLERSLDYRDRPLFLQVSQDRFTHLVAHPQLMRVMIKSKCGDLTIEPIPVLGHSAKEIISHPGMRRVSIPSKHLTFPAMIHGTIYTGLGNYYHDMVYHCLVDSSIPHRKAFIELGLQFTRDEDAELKVLLLDRDVPFYLRPHLFNELTSIVNPNQAHIFWISIITLLDKGCGSDWEKMQRVVKQIIKYVSHPHQKWKELYYIDLAALSTVIDSWKAAKHAQLVATLKSSIVDPDLECE